VSSLHYFKNFPLTWLIVCCKVHIRLYWVEPWLSCIFTYHNIANKPKYCAEANNLKDNRVKYSTTMFDSFHKRFFKSSLGLVSPSLCVCLCLSLSFSLSISISFSSPSLSFSLCSLSLSFSLFSLPLFLSFSLSLSLSIYLVLFCLDLLSSCTAWFIILANWNFWFLKKIGCWQLRDNNMMKQNWQMTSFFFSSNKFHIY
jgi:hypothetical protein